MAYETLIVEKSDHVALIKLDRPDALNALNAQLLAELCKALWDAEKDAEIRVIILTGSDKAFAAGADIKEMSEQTYATAFGRDIFADTSEKIRKIRKPIIGAVAGYALGGGCELAMMCDILIAADTARFGQPEINLGVMPGLGGTQRLTLAIGKSKAMEMALTGRFMEAEEAERAGLVARVVPAKSLMDEAQKTARKITEKSMLAVMATKESVNRAFEVSLTEGLLYERRQFQALFATEDQKEGMAAFIEKRSPQFRDQ